MATPTRADPAAERAALEAAIRRDHPEFDTKTLAAMSLEELDAFDPTISSIPQHDAATTKQVNLMHLLAHQKPLIQLTGKLPDPAPRRSGRTGRDIRTSQYL